MFGMAFVGFQFVSEPLLVDRKQVRFPRSKKRRMRKKWAKDVKNWRSEPSETFYRMGNVVYAHPAMIERLRRELDGAR